MSNNRFTIMADIIPNKSQVQNAVKEMNKELEQATVDTHDTSTRQAQTEIAQLQRLLTTVKNNENAGPGRYKTVDAKGQATLDALEEKLRDVSRMSQSELESTAREVEGQTKMLGAKAAKEISSQLRAIGDAVIQVDKINVSTATIERARARVEAGLGDVTVKAKVVVDDSELKAAQRKVDSLQADAALAAKRTQVTAERRNRTKAEREQEAARVDAGLQRDLKVARNKELLRSEYEIAGEKFNPRDLDAQAERITAREEATGKPRYNESQRNVLKRYINAKDANQRRKYEAETKISDLYQGFDKETNPVVLEEYQRRIGDQREELDRLKGIKQSDVASAFERDYRDATEGVYRRTGVEPWPKYLQTDEVRQARASAEFGGAGTKRDEAQAKKIRERGRKAAERAERVRVYNQERNEQVREDRKREVNPELYAQREAYELARANAVPGEFSYDLYPEGHTLSPKTYGLERDERGVDVLNEQALRRADERALTAFSRGDKQPTLERSDNSARNLYMYQPLKSKRITQAYRDPSDLFRTAAGLSPTDKNVSQKTRSTQVMQFLGLPEDYNSADKLRSADYTVRAGTDLYEELEKRLHVYGKGNQPKKLDNGDYVLGTTFSGDKTKNHQLATLLTNIAGKDGTDFPRAISLLYDREVKDNAGNVSVRPGGLSTNDLFPNVSRNQASKLATDFNLSGDAEGKYLLDELDSIRYMQRTEDYNDDNYVGSREEHERDMRLYQQQQSYIKRANDLRTSFRTETQMGGRNVGEMRKRIASGLKRSISNMSDPGEFLAATYTPQQAGMAARDLYADEFNKLGITNFDDPKLKDIKISKKQQQRFDDIKQIREYSSGKGGGLNETARRLLAEHLSNTTARQIVTEQPTLLTPYNQTELVQPKVFPNTPAYLQSPVNGIVETLGNIRDYRQSLLEKGLKPQDIVGEMESYVQRATKRYQEELRDRPTNVQLPSTGIIEFEKDGDEFDDGTRPAVFSDYADTLDALSNHRLAEANLVGIDTPDGRNTSPDVLARELSNRRANFTFGQAISGKRSLEDFAKSGIRPLDLDKYGHDDLALVQATQRKLDHDNSDEVFAKGLQKEIAAKVNDDGTPFYERSLPSDLTREEDKDELLKEIVRSESKNDNPAPRIRGEGLNIAELTELNNNEISGRGRDANFMAGTPDELEEIARKVATARANDPRTIAIDNAKKQAAEEEADRQKREEKNRKARERRAAKKAQQTVDTAPTYDSAYDPEPIPTTPIKPQASTAEVAANVIKYQKALKARLDAPNTSAGTGISIAPKVESMQELVSGVKKLDLNIGGQAMDTAQRQVDEALIEMIKTIQPNAVPTAKSVAPAQTLRNMDKLTGQLAGQVREVKKLQQWQPKIPAVPELKVNNYKTRNMDLIAGQMYNQQQPLYPNRNVIPVKNNSSQPVNIPVSAQNVGINVQPGTNRPVVAPGGLAPNAGGRYTAGSAWAKGMGTGFPTGVNLNNFQGGKNLYTPTVPLVDNNPWLDPKRAAQIKTFADIEAEKKIAFGNKNNKFAQRIKTVGDDLAENLNKSDYYGARTRGLSTSARQFQQVEAQNAAQIREEAGKRIAQIMGITEQQFRTKNGRGVSAETAFSAVMGGKIDRSVIDDDSVLKTAADYAKRVVQSTGDAGGIISQAQAELKAMRIRRDDSRTDVTGFARDDVIRSKVKTGRQLSSEEQRRYDGLTRTDNLRREAESVAGRFGMSYAEFTDSSRGQSVMSLAQQATGLTNNKMAALDIDAISNIVGPIRAASAAMEAFGANSMEFKEAMDQARDAGREAIDNSAALNNQTTQANDNQRRYQREISKIINARNFRVGDNYQGSPITQTDINRSNRFQADAAKLVGQRYVNAAGQTAVYDASSSLVAARAQLADRIATSNERKGMVKAGLVNMGAFLGGSLLEQGITQVGTMVTDTIGAKKMLQRAVDVQGVSYGADSAKPGWWPGLSGGNNKTDAAWKVVSDYSGKLGATRTETATLLTQLSMGGANSLNSVEEAMISLSRASQNTGTTLKDMLPILQSLDQINIDGLEGAELLGKYGGLNKLNLENIGAAATQVAASPNAMLYSQAQREQLVVGLSQNLKTFKGFDQNAYVAAKQAEGFMQKGRQTQGATPELKKASGIDGWAKSLVDVNKLMQRLTEFIDQAYKALQPVIGVFVALVSAVLDVSTAALTAFNSMTGFSTIIGVLAGVTAAVWGLNAALAALGTGGLVNSMKAVGGGLASGLAVITGGTALKALTSLTGALGGIMTGMRAASAAGAGFGLTMTAGLGAARVAVQAFLASIGPVGWIIGAVGLAAGAIAGVAMKNSAATAKETKENKEREEKTAEAYKTVATIRDSGVLNRYDGVTGQPKFKPAVQIADDTEFVGNFARALAGDPNYSIDSIGISASNAQDALQQLTDSGQPGMMALAEKVRKAREEIDGYKLAIEGAQKSSDLAYSATKFTEKNSVGAADIGSFILNKPTENFKTDEDIEVKALQEKKRVYNADLANRLDQQGKTLEDLPVQERAQIAEVQQTNEENIVKAQQAALKVRGDIAVSQAKLNDDKLIELRATEKSISNERELVATTISQQLAQSALGEAHANINQLQLRANELALKQKQTQEMILQTIMEQAFAMQNYLDLQQQLSDTNNNTELGSGADLAGQIEGTSASLQTGAGEIKNYYENLMKTLDNKPGGMNANDKKLYNGLVQLAPDIAAADSVDRRWSQELESAAKQQNITPVSDADYLAKIQEINTRGQAQMNAALANLDKRSKELGIANQTVSGAQQGVNVAAGWNQSQGFGATDFAQAQKGKAAWKGTAYYNGIHDGRDYAMPIGTQLRAPTGGMLEYTGDRNDGFGSRTKLKLDDGRTLMYAHQDQAGLAALMAKLGIKRGGSTRINAGDLMGISGDSGNGGKHLHAGLYDANGNAIDPNLLLSGQGVSGNQSINTDVLAPLRNPRLVNARGTAPARNAQDALTQTMLQAQQSAAEVNENNRDLNDVISASADGVGAANAYGEKLSEFNNSFARRLKSMESTYNSQIKLIDAKIAAEKDPDRKAELQRDKQNLTTRYRTNRQELITSGRGQAADIFVDGAIAKAGRVPLVDGKATPEVLKKQIAILQQSIKSAQTEVDPRFGLTIQQAEPGTYGRLLGELKEKQDALALKKKNRTRTDFARNINSLYGSVTGFAVGAENQAEVLRDRIVDNEDYTLAEKEELGVDAKGRIIAGSKLDNIRALSNSQNNIKRRITDYDTQVQINQLAAGKDLYKIDRAGNLRNAQAIYMSESAKFDKQRNRFPDQASFEYAKQVNLQDPRKRVVDAQKAIDSWGKAMKGIDREVRDTRISLGLGNQGTKARGVQDKIDNLLESGQVAPDSEQIRSLESLKTFAKQLDAGTIVTENFKDDFESEQINKRDSLYSIDRQGMKNRAEAELKWAQNTFDTKIGSGLPNEQERNKARADYLKDFIANLKMATEELDTYSKYVRDARTTVAKQGEDLGFAIAGGTRANSVRDQITTLSKDTKINPNDPMFKQLNQQLEVARMYDAFEQSAKTTARNRETEAAVNAETVQNIDYDANFEKAKNEYNDAIIRATAKRLDDGSSLNAQQIATMTSGQRDNYLKAQAAKYQEEDFIQSRAKSVTTMGQQLGLEAQPGSRTKQVQDLIENLEKAQRNRQGDEDYTPLREQANEQLKRAEQMDKADDTLRLARKEVNKYGVTDASKSFYLNAEATQAWTNSMKAAGNISKETQDQIDEMNLSLDKQAQNITDTAKKFVTDYAAALRQVGLMSTKLSANLGTFDKSIGYRAEQTYQIGQSKNKVTDLEATRDQRLTQFLRQEFDANSAENIIGPEAFAKYKPFLTQVKGVGAITNDTQRANLQTEVFNKQFGVELQSAQQEVASTLQNSALGLIDRLEGFVPNEKFTDMSSILTDPNETRSIARILSDSRSDLEGSLQFGVDTAASNPEFYRQYNDTRGTAAQTAARRRLQQIENLQNSQQGLNALQEIRDTRAGLKNKNFELASVVGETDQAEAARARIQGEINTMTTRMGELALIIKGIVPEADLDELTNVVPDGSALRKLKEKALSRVESASSAYSAEAEEAYSNTAKRSYSPTATAAFYNNSIASKQAELVRAANRSRELQQAEITGAFGGFGEDFGNTIKDPKRKASFDSAMSIYNSTRGASGLLGKTTAELYAMPDVDTTTIENIIKLNSEIRNLGEEGRDALANIAEGRLDLANNLRDAVGESSAIRMDRALGARDYAGAGRNAALTVGDMQNRIIASINAADDKNYGSRDFGEIVSQYSMDKTYGPQIADVIKTSRELQQQINSTATMNTYDDTLKDFDRDTQRARPKLSERAADEFDLRILQQKLGFQKGIDTTKLDPSAQKSVLDDIRNTNREIEAVTNKMQNRWRDFWNDIGSDLIGTLKQGFSQLMKNMLDQMFQIESERDKKLRLDVDNSETRKQFAIGDEAQANIDADYAKQMRDSATTVEDRQYWAGVYADAMTRAMNSKQAARAEDSTQAQLGNEKAANDREDQVGVWATAVENMKNSFVEKISGEMFDEYIGKGLQSLFDKISGVQDPQITATQALSQANVDLATAVVNLPVSISTAFEAVTTAQITAANNMLLASQNMLTASTTVVAAGIASTAGSLFGVSYTGGTGLGTTPNTPYDNTGQPSLPFGSTYPGMGEFKPMSITAPASTPISAQAAPTQTPKLIGNPTVANFAAGGVSALGQAINIPSTGDELGDYGVGFLKNTIISGTATWVAAGAAGGIAGLGATVGAALTNPVTAAIAAVGAGIMLLNNYTQNQKRIAEYQAAHQYNNTATGATNYGTSDKTAGRRWMSVDGQAFGNSSTPTISALNVHVDEPLNSVRSQMAIGRAVSQTTSLELMRRGVNV